MREIAIDNCLLMILVVYMSRSFDALMRYYYIQSNFPTNCFLMFPIKQCHNNYNYWMLFLPPKPHKCHWTYLFLDLFQGSDNCDFKFSCSYQKCHNKELVEVTCSHCAMTVCLQHRHPQDHDCVSTLKQSPTEQQIALQKVNDIAKAIADRPRKFKAKKDPKLAAKVCQ